MAVGSRQLKTRLHVYTSTRTSFVFPYLSTQNKGVWNPAPRFGAVRLLRSTPVNGQADGH